MKVVLQKIIAPYSQPNRLDHGLRWYNHPRFRPVEEEQGHKAISGLGHRFGQLRPFQREIDLKIVRSLFSVNFLLTVNIVAYT